MAADDSGGRLGLMAVVGFLLIEVGLTGRLGSLLGAIIDPNSMTEINQGGGSNGLNGDNTGLNTAGIPTSGTLTPTQIATLVIRAGFTASSVQVATAIALAESQGRTNAHNPGNGTTDIEDSYGLWQINVLAHPSYNAKSLYNPTYNAHAAYDISSGGTNWYPWGTYTSGAYLSYMNTALAGAQAAATQNIAPGI